MTTTIEPSVPRIAPDGVDAAPRRRAVVIGGGFGGIASALRLRAVGFDVELVDRGERLGGRARVFERGGYRHDAGPTVLTAPFLFDELFELFDKRREDYIDFLPVAPWYRFQFHDESTFDYGGTLESTLEEIRRISPEDVDGYRRMVEDSRRIFDKGFTELADRPFHRIATMVRCLPDLLRLRCWRTVWNMVRGHIRSTKLRQAFSIQPLLVGGNPLDTTCIYSLIHYLERRWGVWFPRGGTGALVDALGRLLAETGVRVRLETTVDEILVAADGSSRSPRVTGVRLADGTTIEADTVVANADPPHVYTHMLPSVRRRRRWSARSVSRMRFSMGLFVLYFGTKRTYDDVAHHTILLGPRYEGLLRDIFDRGVLARDMSMYLHRPTATDRSFAPDGRDSFYVLVPVPNLAKNPIDWAEEGPRLADRIVQELDRRILPGLRETIDEPFFMSPSDFQQDYLSMHGAGFSVQPIFTQSAWFRFHNKSEEVDGLFFAGAGTHPGAGMPGVLSSAKIASSLADHHTAERRR
jgi:phytoene desaturase